MEVRSIHTHKLHDISFTLHKARFLGLVGLVGAGRTEIVRAIYGADKARGHEVLLGGVERRTIRNPRHAKEFGIGLNPEDRKLQGLVLPFPCNQNISHGASGSSAGWASSEIGGEVHWSAQVQALSIKTPSNPGAVNNLSGGNQQKVIVGPVAGDLPANLYHDGRRAASTSAPSTRSTSS